jgi:hypothetical protein
VPSNRLSTFELAPDALDVRGDGAVIDDQAGRFHQLIATLDMTGVAGQAWTIQNSVTVRATGRSSQRTEHRFGIQRELALTNQLRCRLGRAAASTRRNKATMRASSWAVEMSLVR